MPAAPAVRPAPAPHPGDRAQGLDEEEQTGDGGARTQLRRVSLSWYRIARTGGRDEVQKEEMNTSPAEGEGQPLGRRGRNKIKMKERLYTAALELFAEQG
ncbi:hypothetical protein SRO_4268 [Streptomyces rochei]|nr:hypothetical protein SRO_4268 [Streptomyces rochei]